MSLKKKVEELVELGVFDGLMDLELLEFEDYDEVSGVLKPTKESEKRIKHFVQAIMEELTRD